MKRRIWVGFAFLLLSLGIWAGIRVFRPDSSVSGSSGVGFEMEFVEPELSDVWWALDRLGIASRGIRIQADPERIRYIELFWEEYVAGAPVSKEPLELKLAPSAYSFQEASGSFDLSLLVQRREDGSWNLILRNQGTMLTAPLMDAPESRDGQFWEMCPSGYSVLRPGEMVPVALYAASWQIDNGEQLSGTFDQMLQRSPRCFLISLRLTLWDDSDRL